MGWWLSVAVAVTFVWLGMVLAISFMEAPLKFRAPGITVPLGLGIGRLVFRALNGCELVLAAVLAVSTVAGGPGAPASAATAVAIAVLLAQLALVRPLLTRRSDAVLAGADVPRSRAHLAYLALELVKVLALVAGGVLLLA
ncbi:hypothetical protein SAMN05421874_11861 [Nonomuraea maritima]|uniref:DUF4149 domain-containing protein n=1 Tax=Nonomuraea maritima TaxID=683260 RepID=A0A1G9IIF3_9ACTN|nr:hypothetical protein [Nonomuraea maritima]SDL24892.1 hypothetical protein SAMN05421874_11861 [Nonomuraea maritima]